MSGLNVPPLTGSVPPSRMAILFIVMLVTAAGNTAIQSLLPATGARLGVPDIIVSMAVSWSAVLWTISAPRWSKQSEQRGRRALMKLGLAGFVVAMLLSGLVLAVGLKGWLGGTLVFVLFIGFRSIYGWYGAAAPPAVQAYVAARTSREERTGALALIASSFGLGTVLGPAVAPYLIVPSIGAPSAFVAFALFGLLVLLILHFGLPDDTPRYAARGRAMSEPSSTLGGAAEVAGDDGEGDDGASPAPRLGWRDRRVFAWMVAGLIGGHAQAMMMGMLGFLILDRLDLRATPEAAFEPTGLTLTFGAVATLLAQWGLIPMLHMGPRASVLWGGALAALGSVMLAGSNGLHAIALSFGVASLGFGLFRPGFTSGASLAVDRAQQDAVAGMVTAINGAAWVFAPAVGVAIYGVSPGAVFTLIAGTCAAMLLWAWRSLPR